MTLSSRRKHQITAPTTPAATAHERRLRWPHQLRETYRRGDISRAVLVIVTVLAALIGIVTRAAMGQEGDANRPSSRRVVVEQPNQQSSAAIVEGNAATPVTRQPTTTIVVGSDSKRYVANSQSSAAPSNQGTTLQWRTRRPAHFKAVQPAQPTASAVQPAAFNELPDATPLRPSGLRVAQSSEASRVQPAQGSRFTDPPTGDEDAPAPFGAAQQPPLDLPDLLPPTAPTDPLVPPDTGNGDLPPLDDLLPPTIPDEPGRLPDPRDDFPGDLDIPRVTPPTDRGAKEKEKEKKKPVCRESYRDTNCCEQGKDCRKAWDDLEGNRVGSFQMGFLDITPRYAPDLGYDKDEPADEAKARRKGLSLNAERTWKNKNGKALGIQDGEVVGLDGSDWEAAWRDEADAADLAGRSRPARPTTLTGKVVGNISGNTITVKTADDKTVTLSLNQLSLDDNYWISGRPWRGRNGDQLAYGRLVDYQWGRAIIEQSGGSRTQVDVSRLGDDELCYLTAYWGDGVGLPDSCRIKGQLVVRDFTMLSYHWKASALCHKPLYFEEVALERYGHTVGPLAQPFVSTAHFFGNIAILPYRMGINPPTECRYALGYYRPGSCAPYMINPMPLSIRGALYQTGAIVGGVAIFP